MKTWEDWANKVESGCITRGLSIKAIEAYKQALREKVTKEMFSISSRYAECEAYERAKRDFLHAIETVKPKDE